MSKVRKRNKNYNTKLKNII